jgi:hypothetical protein
MYSLHGSWMIPDMSNPCVGEIICSGWEAMQLKKKEPRKGIFCKSVQAGKGEI